MKQVLQQIRTGRTELADVPAPRATAGNVLIRSSQSLLSAGTERMLVEFAKASLFAKACQQPDKVRMVIEKAKVDGLSPALEAVRNKLDRPLPLGYCNAGVVVEVGDGVRGFRAGDRVASNGNHAGIVSVPANLCAHVPEGVPDEDAAFTVVGAIALQGVRLMQPTLGEGMVVTGLGLIGLMTVQLLRAHGCRVLGLDFDTKRLELARHFGADVVNLSAGEDALAAARSFSRGRGVDGVIIAASTRSSDPVHQAALMCRKRGRIVLVGVTGLELSRADFYEKEISFQVSCSYGPGRYDPDFEERGHDYPIGFVRWTAQRNFEAVLDMMSDGRLAVEPLISHRFPIDQAAHAYSLMANDAYSLGITLHYPGSKPDETELPARTVPLRAPSLVRTGGVPRVAFIGIGDYASRVLIPAFEKAGVRLRSAASARGVSSVHCGRKHGFEEATTDTESVLADPAIDVAVIATRHDSHAQFVCDALKWGKHVFVEKPLAITRPELAEIEAAYAGRGAECLLMAGFNRRFSPHVRRVKALLERTVEPKAFVMTVNAGAVPADHWTLDPAVGGGRIVGEACHFIDLLRFLAGAQIVSVQAAALQPTVSAHSVDCGASFILQFADGSTGTVHYLTNGHRSFPKERLEIFCGGRMLVLDNFRRLQGAGWARFKSMNLWRQDKGNQACVMAFVDAVQHGQSSPIPFEEQIEVTRVSFDVAEAAACS